MMQRAELLVIYFCTVLVLCALYATQPIAPILQTELNITAQEASLFTTAAMTPLAFASIIYGYLLEKIVIKKLLCVAFLSLGISEIIFSVLDSYFWLLNLRGFQGLLIPMVLIGIMSYIAQINTASSVATAIAAVVVYKNISSITASVIKPSLKDIFNTLKIRLNLSIYIMIFCVFFAFQAILNFIPFELAKMGEYSGVKTGLLYSGYFVGVLVAFGAGYIVLFLRGALNAIIAGWEAFLWVIGAVNLFGLIAVLIFRLSGDADAKIGASGV